MREADRSAARSFTWLMIRAGAVVLAVLVLLIVLAGCATRATDHSVCYVFSWNATVTCWPEGSPKP